MKDKSKITLSMNQSDVSMDKNSMSVASLTDASDEIHYWLKKTPTDRLQSLELMRQILYGYDPVTTRLQRVFEVAERK